VTHDASPAPVTTGCLTEEEILAFAGGYLSPQRREDAHAHLDECELCQELLNEAVRGLGTAVTTDGFDEDEEPAWNTTFRPGTVVGNRYLIRRFVARGGMGEVYEALDQELQERVALKTVTSTACDDPLAVRRLKAEVQLARRVSHPNVCRIYDFGTHVSAESGTQVAFLTMEFVDGPTLGRHIRDAGPLSTDEASRIARQLLQGLKAAHDAGVLHRDFKSDNVMLRLDGDKLCPLIMDFGLARGLDQYRQQSQSSSRGLVGTLAYSAPEQLEGKPNTIASDIYSLGVVWFEMLTGELPNKPRSAPAVTTLDRLLRPPPAPSSRRSSVPRFVDEVVLGCLRRSPDERFQSAGAVLSRLDELQNQPPNRRRSRVARGAVAALVIAGTFFVLREARQAAPRESLPRPATAAAVAAPTPSVTKPIEPAPPAASSMRERGSATRQVATRVTPPPRRSDKPRPARPSATASASSTDNARRPNAGSDALEATSSPPPAAHHGWENPFSEPGPASP
jgi:serine/threonine protein kinase